MQETLNRFFATIQQPMALGLRIPILVLALLLVASFSFPLWEISMKAPQYPEGLTLDIYLYKVEGGNEGHDIKEINTLNHYIGMAPIDRGQLVDLDWMPFAIGFLFLMCLRTAAIGSIRILIDLFVITVYVTSFALARFIYRLWVLGHDLDPTAPVNVEPFTPAILGTMQVANFTISSYPRPASVLVALVVVGMGAILARQLWIVRDEYWTPRAEERAEERT